MKKYANIFTITILLFLVQIACQKAEIESNMASKNDYSINSIGFQSEGSLFRKKLVEARKQSNLKKESPILNFQSGVELSKNARMAAAEKGCGKFKTITTSFPNEGFDQYSVVVYKANNLIDYIDYSYSDDPSLNGRLLFNYNLIQSTITLSYKYVDGVTTEYVDIISLNEKGYAKTWYHDLSNYLYDKPYTESITYNSAGFPISFSNSIGGKAVTLKSVKYTSAMNYESVSDAISGDVLTYTNDLARPSKVALSSTPFFWDYSHLYGVDNPNYWTKIETKDKNGKLKNMIEIQREFNADGYPTKATRKINGVTELIFKDITYDCKNYNISQPRSYK